MNINVDKYMPQEKTTVTICNKEYEVNDDYRNVIKFTNMQESMDSLEKIEEALTIAVGEDAAKEVMADKLSFNAFKHVTIGLLAAMTGEDMDVMERRVSEEKALEEKRTGEQFRKSNKSK